LNIAGFVLLLLVLAWGLAAGYILMNKKTLLKRTKTELNKQTRGGLSIGNMDLFLFHDFPYIDIGLSGVVLRDSLWTQHRHDLLRAEKIFIRLTPGSLFSAYPRAGKLFMEQGSIYLFTDTTGYSNSRALRYGNPPADAAGASRSRERGKLTVPDLYFDEVRLVIDKKDRRELVDLNFRQLECTVKKKERALFLRINMAMVVKSLVFDTRNGSFLIDKSVTGSFSLQYNPASRILQGQNLELQLAGQLFRCSGRFFLNVTPDPFNFTLQGDRISYKDAIGLFPLHLREKLNGYAIDRPVSLSLTIDAGLADKPEPLATVRLITGKEPGANKAVGSGGSRRSFKGAGGMDISYKGPFYINDSTADSAVSVRQGNLDLDSIRWEPFKKALKNNR
jgi:hypothetical protein